METLVPVAISSLALILAYAIREIIALRKQCAEVRGALLAVLINEAKLGQQDLKLYGMIQQMAAGVSVGDHPGVEEMN